MRNVTIKFANKGKEISEIKAEEVDLLEIVEYARKLKKVTTLDTEKESITDKIRYTKKVGRGPQWTFHDIMFGVNLLKQSPGARNGKELIRLIRANGDYNNRKAVGIRTMANQLFHYLYDGNHRNAGMSESNAKMLKDNNIMEKSLTRGTSIPITYKKEYLPSLTPKEA